MLLEELARASYENSDHIVEMVKTIVTTFQPVGDKPTGKEFLRKSGQGAGEAAVTTEEE